MFILNLFDVAVVSIILITALLAFFRGFIKELLSVISWFIAMSVSYLLSPLIINSFFENSQYSEMLIDIGVRTVLFTVFLIIMSIVSSKICAATDGKIPGSIDKSLGFAIGFSKAYFIVSLFFSILTTFYSHELLVPKNDQDKKIVKNSRKRVGPSWLQEAGSYGFLKVGAEIVQPVTDAAVNMIKKSNSVKIRDFNEEDQNNDGKSEGSDQIIEKIEELKELKNTVDDNVVDELKNNPKNQIENQVKNQKGYSKKERQKLDHLIDVIDK